MIMILFHNMLPKSMAKLLIKLCALRLVHASKEKIKQLRNNGMHTKIKILHHLEEKPVMKVLQTNKRSILHSNGAQMKKHHTQVLHNATMKH